MNVIALLGDCTTTTALALAAVWPTTEDVVVLESDRTGGSLTAWLDTPRTPTLSTIVTTLAPNQPGTSWESIEPNVHTAHTGTRFIAAPVHSIEANRAVAEADTTLFPLLARLPGPAVLADLGRHTASQRPPPLAERADAIVVCHRQHAASPAAAGVRLERCAELVESLRSIAAPILLAVIGERPFDIAEIEQFVSADGACDVVACPLADDSLAAAVLAGRAGVSGRRFARLPLVRSARPLVQALTELAATEPEAAADPDALEPHARGSDSDRYEDREPDAHEVSA